MFGFVFGIRKDAAEVHWLPGRIRVGLQGLYGRPHMAGRIESYVAEVPGIRSVRANPDSGQVLICYDPRTLAPGALLTLLATGRCAGWRRRPVRQAWEQHPWAKEVAASLQESPRPRRPATGWPGDVTGLSSVEARHRLIRYGPNALKETPRPSFWVRLLEQFKDPMVLTLLGGAGISMLAGRVRDALTISAILVLNAVVGAGQAGKAEGSLDALRRMSAPSARVLRDGRPITIPTAEVVPGDLLLVEAGDKIAADALVVQSIAAEAEESMLTGESLPVEKCASCPGAPQDGGIGRADMLFSGTTLTRGRCLARVTATGMKTEMGRIATLLGEVKEGPTPLQDRMDELGRTLVKGSLLVCGGVALIGLLRGQPLGEMLLTGVSLAVAAIPEGLPTFVTLGLAAGVRQMARRNAMVRRLQAVETLGSATVICTDKTGTLTRNQMTVRQVYAGGKTYDVTGAGYDPRGEFRRGQRRIEPLGEPDLALLLSVGALCNNTSLEQEGGDWVVRGDATEGALLVAALKAGIDPVQYAGDHGRIAEVPFDSIRRRMTVICHGPNGPCLYTKGAPEELLTICTHVLRGGRPVRLDAQGKKEILAAAGQMAGRAYRVLGAAYRPVAEGETEHKEEAMIFLGLTGLIDPPRPEVPVALKRCRRAGIRVVMLTGDHPATAEAVAREIGLLDQGGLVLTGEEIAGLDDARLRDCVGRLRVCARVSPEQKLRVVRALRARGEVVAMTGDGVNDAPAVKEADIGVAMGCSGTEVTKEAASLVLADDNFATIVAAVEQGRVTYNNIRKSIRYLLASNIGEMLLMAAAIGLGLPLPLIPLQILWLNLVGDGLPALALGTEPADGTEMQHPPRPRSESVFACGLGRRILSHGLRMGAAGLALFLWALRAGKPLGVVRTMTLCSLVIGQLLYLLRCRSESDGRGGRKRAPNPAVKWALVASLALLIGSVYAAPLRNLLQLQPLRSGEWAVAALSAGVGAL